VQDHDHAVHHEDHTEHAHGHGPDQEEADPLTRLEQAVGKVRKGDAAGLTDMAKLVQSAPPFIRMEAHDRLSILAGKSAPVYDPLAGTDTAGVWMKWAQAPGEGWQSRKNTITIP
jgi:hypothetical protein